MIWCRMGRATEGRAPDGSGQLSVSLRARDQSAGAYLNGGGGPVLDPRSSVSLTGGHRERRKRRGERRVGGRMGRRLRLAATRWTGNRERSVDPRLRHVRLPPTLTLIARARLVCSTDQSAHK